jgi:hypothetical protein
MASKGKSPPPPPVHVGPNPGGGWDVKREGAGRASVHSETKQPAVDRGREIAQNAGAELVVHNKDGKIGQKDSHGRDDAKKKG